MLLNAENLEQIKFKTKRVKLTKTDAEINVALLSGALAAEMRDFKKGSDDLDAMGFKMLSAAVVDDAGNPVFESKEAFEALPLAVQNEILEAILDYNGMSQKSQEALVKNSGSNRREGSVSN